LSDVSPIGGTKILPLAPLVCGMNGWGCGSWCRGTHQGRRGAGSAPSSSSVAAPAYGMLSPPLNVAFVAGWVMVADGAAFPPDVPGSDPHAPKTSATVSAVANRTRSTCRGSGTWWTLLAVLQAGEFATTYTPLKARSTSSRPDETTLMETLRNAPCGRQNSQPQRVNCNNHSHSLSFCTTFCAICAHF